MFRMLFQLLVDVQGLGGFLLGMSIYVFLFLFTTPAAVVAFFIFHVAFVPLVFKYCTTFQRNIIVFLNFVQWPLNIDHENPASSGIDGTRNFYIDHNSKVDKCPVKIGLWHILSKSSYDKLKGYFQPGEDTEVLNKVLDEELANTTTPIIFYCHGNSNTRAATHRIKMYRKFQQMGYHTITFDYRGYGDSTNLVPSENGVVEDALVVYDWLHSVVSRNGNSPPIYVWGHSLGTAISSHLVGNLPSLSSSVLDRSVSLPLPKGLILEAPFNNLAEEVEAHPLCKLVYWLPYFDQTFVEPFRCSEDYRFKSDQHLSKIPNMPILMLHAKDDLVIPFYIGYRLFKHLQSSRKQGGASLKLHAYERSDKLGHLSICDAHDLKEVVSGFIESNLQ